jgi:hypothetical protein
LQVQATSGWTVYFNVRNDAGQPWNGVAYESYNASNYSTYKVAAAEQGASGYFVASFAPTGGRQTWVAKHQSGGSPAESDAAIATGTLGSNLVEIDGNATNGNNATLNLKQLNVVNSDGDAVVAQSTGGNGNGFNISGNGTGHGFLLTGGATGDGLHSLGGATSGHGALFQAQTSGSGLRALAAGSFAGLRAVGGTGTPGMQAVGGSSGDGFVIQGGSGNTNGIRVSQSGTGDGVNICNFGASNGHGVNILAAPGVSGAHGLTAQGGTSGTCDGIHAAAGTGGVDLRGNLTGNVTGNLSGSVGSLLAAGLDAVLIEQGFSLSADVTNDAGTQLPAINLRQAVALCLSVLAGVLSGAGTTDVKTQPGAAPLQNTRVNALVDTHGNRNSVVLKVPN